MSKLPCSEIARPSLPLRPSLSHLRIMAAALDLIDAEGLEALTMRRLAQRLRYDPMALYRYAPNRAAVLDGVVELVLGQLVIPTDTTDWQAQLRRSAHELRALALTHPNVVALLVTRPLATPFALRPLATLRPLEQLLTLLVNGGFTPVEALHAYRAYTGLVYGHILDELQELVVDPDETDDLLRLGLQRLPRREFPHLRALASVLARYDGATELDHAIDLLLAGLQDRTPTHLRDEPSQE